MHIRMTFCFYKVVLHHIIRANETNCFSLLGCEFNVNGDISELSNLIYIPMIH